MYACNGILFNHESPRRGETFVTRKVTRGLANIAQGVEQCLYMGNMDPQRDWGHAKTMCSCSGCCSSRRARRLRDCHGRAGHGA